MNGWKSVKTSWVSELLLWQMFTHFSFSTWKHSYFHYICTLFEWDPFQYRGRRGDRGFQRLATGQWAVVCQVHARRRGASVWINTCSRGCIKEITLGKSSFPQILITIFSPCAVFVTATYFSLLSCNFFWTWKGYVWLYSKKVMQISCFCP